MSPALGVAATQCRILMVRRGLFERSEFRSPTIRDWGKGTRRATHGPYNPRPWRERVG